MGHRTDRRGAARHRGDDDEAGDPLRLRQCCPMGAACRPRHAGDGGARHAGAAHARRNPRRGPEDSGRLRGQGRRSGAVSVELPGIAPSAGGADRCRDGSAGNRYLVAAMVESMPRPGSLARGGAALVDHTEGADLPAHRRHRRRGDDIAARAGRRRAQLGLPLLLAARCHLHARRTDLGGLYGRGIGLARMVAAHGGRLASRLADAVQRDRRTTADRTRTAVAARLRRRRAGAHRQCGVEAVPTRCLWRSHGHAAPGASRRIAAAAACLADPAVDPRFPLDTLA